MSFEQPPVKLSRIAFLLPLAGIVVALLFLEIFFRIFAGKKVSQWDDRPNSYFMPASAPDMLDQGYPEKHAETFRIAVVGDSFTFGPFLQYDDTFPKRLERFLNLNNKGKTVEVRNRGFSGYSTKNEISVIQDAIKDKADLIILEITLNDAESKLLSDEEREKLFGAKFLSSSVLNYWKSLGFVLSRLHNSQTHQAYIKYHAELFTNPETHDVFKESLAKISSLAAEANIKIIAVVFPMFAFPINERYPFRETHKIIQSDLESAKIPFLDLTDIYKGIPPERLQVIPGKDSHPNEIAHRMAAEQLLYYMSSKRLIPSENIPGRVYPARKNTKERRRDVWPKHNG